MKNQVQQGDALYVTAGTQVGSVTAMTSGNGYIFGAVGAGAIFGVAAYTAAAGTSAVIYIRGIFTLAKASADNWDTIGKLLYWNTTNNNAQLTASTFHPIGVVAALAAGSTTVGQVLLLPTAVAT